MVPDYTRIPPTIPPTVTTTESRCIACGNLYQKLPNAKSGRCCNCRKIKRQAQKVKPRPNVTPEAFTTQADLDAWYSADKLRCHICGGAFAGLYRHLGMAHGMDVRQYKERFGIPMTYGLSGRATRIKQQACGAATTDKQRLTGFKNLANGRAKKTGTRVAWTPYQSREHVLQMIESPNHPSQLEGEVEVTCTKCGNPYPMSAKVACAFQCRAVCPSCAK